MYFWKQNSLDLRNFIHAWTHDARTHEFPALGRPHSCKTFWQKISFGGNLQLMRMHVVCPFNFLWSNTMLRRWRKLYFCSWFSRRKSNCLWFRLKSWRCRDLVVIKSRTFLGLTTNHGINFEPNNWWSVFLKWFHFCGFFNFRRDVIS